MARTLSRLCLGAKSKQFLKKIVIVLLFQILGWFAYTYMEEGFPLTDCLFNTDNIRQLKASNDAKKTGELYQKLNETLMGDLNASRFEIYYDEFTAYFEVKERRTETVDISAICTKWYLFTAITLTTVGYGNVVPKTMAGKIVFLPYCLTGIPLMLFFLGYIGQLIAALSNAVVEALHHRINHTRQSEIAHKELKSFFVTFAMLWTFIIIETVAAHYLPKKEDRLTIVDGIYFFFVSFTTIGYGDITSPMNETLFEFRLYIGLSLMSGVVNAALEFYQKFSERRAEGNREGTKVCCCRKHNSRRVEIQPEEEMVVVGNKDSQKEVELQLQVYKGYKNGGFTNEKSVHKKTESSGKEMELSTKISNDI